MDHELAAGATGASAGGAGTGGRPAEPERERTQFRALLLQNPNYFGNLEVSELKPVKVLQSDTSYEQLECIGLNPPYNRLEGVIQIKRELGYGGTICTPGSREYVRFYVDLFNNSVWHDVGLTSVVVHDIPGDKPLCYAVKLDFSPIRKLCLFANTVKVRAILSWNVPPPANTPNFVPVYGNRLDAEVQVNPRHVIFVDDLFEELELAKVKLPTPAGPVIKALAAQSEIQALPPETLSLAQKKALYARTDVPPHRYGFAEAQQLLSTAQALPTIFNSGKESLLQQLGLAADEIAKLVAGLQPKTDGDTSFEELRCVGLYPDSDLVEAVLTVKKPTGYSGGLCTTGSTEYVAFWIDFGDGAGFTYVGTATVKVHDIANIPAGGLHYAVFLKTNLANRLIPCDAGPRVVRLLAILSWETPPPPANPSYVPVWGNREECLVQLRPGALVGHIPTIETVGDVGINDIDQSTGLATGDGVVAGFHANQSPFGGVVTITGRIGNPPDAFGGGAVPFKYRIEVSPDGVDDWHPLTNQITVKVSEAVNGIPIQCDPINHPGDIVCDQVLVATDDGDGLGDGWYTYLEDLSLPSQRFLVNDVLGHWLTNASMEGLWKIRITAKNPATSPPTVFPGVQTVKVRIDNTAPSAPPAPAKPLTITGATFNGNPIPAVDCGKFPVGTILTGTYEVHDPGTSAPEQHFGSLSLQVIPAAAAHGALVNPSSRSFPVVPTTGEAGTWTLDTHGMDPCGYVIRLTASDRTVVNSGFVGFTSTFDIGFCLVEAPTP